MQAPAPVNLTIRLTEDLSSALKLRVARERKRRPALSLSNVVREILARALRAEMEEVNRGS